MFVRTVTLFLPGPRIGTNWETRLLIQLVQPGIICGLTDFTGYSIANFTALWASAYSSMLLILSKLWRTGGAHLIMIKKHPTPKLPSINLIGIWQRTTGKNCIPTIEIIQSGTARLGIALTWEYNESPNITTQSSELSEQPLSGSVYLVSPSCFGASAFWCKQACLGTLYRLKSGPEKHQSSNSYTAPRIIAQLNHCKITKLGNRSGSEKHTHHFGNSGDSIPIKLLRSFNR